MYLWVFASFIVIGIFIIYSTLAHSTPPSNNVSFVALNYMKYNGPEWYAACVASFMCLIIFVIFLNVIQFEIYNRLEVCHPYFYQSSACRKLIAHGISSNPSFKNMKMIFQRKRSDKPRLPRLPSKTYPTKQTTLTLTSFAK